MANVLGQEPNSNSASLSPREWLLTLALFTATCITLPAISKNPQKADPNYRVPYPLSNDYWSYSKHVSQGPVSGVVSVVGDSVIWGEYVSRDGTLSHFLSKGTGQTFVNHGLNGLYPLALEGLIKYHAEAIQNRKVLLHLNLLWLSSPERDLQSPKEQIINHPQLIPQFTPYIPSYHAPIETRLSRSIEKRFPFLAFINHINENCFEQHSAPEWTCLESLKDPELYPNSYANPFKQLTSSFSTAFLEDPERGKNSFRHKSWSGAPRNLEWVTLESSLQWKSLQRLINLLQSRGNKIYVLVGPLNQHMLTQESRARLSNIRTKVSEWLHTKSIKHSAPAPLLTEHYADASHPLTQGYEQLAKTLIENKSFSRWLNP